MVGTEYTGTYLCKGWKSTKAHGVLHLKQKLNHFFWTKKVSKKLLLLSKKPKMLDILIFDTQKILDGEKLLFTK